MQHIGMPFIIMQQVMPGIIIAVMQSQQAWIVFSQFLSPLLQVILQPISIISTVHMPIMPRLQVHMHMPFIIMQHEHIPFCIMLIMLFIMVALTLSSHTQVIIMPPGHFSMVMVQRGAIIMPGMLPAIMGMPDTWPIMPIPPMGIMPFIIEAIGMFIPVVIPRSVIIPVVMAFSCVEMARRGPSV
jgi:hypothetical protein